MRTLVFNTKGAQIGYIELNRAFDLAARERCNYDTATGNLSDLNGGKILGHISLDGTFIGLSWIADELFGKSGGEVHPDRALARKKRRNVRLKNTEVLELENVSVKEQNGVQPPTGTVAQLASGVDHPQPISTSGMDQGTSTSTRSEQKADEAPVFDEEKTAGESDRTKFSSTEDELLGQALGMIRSALA